MDNVKKAYLFDFHLLLRLFSLRLTDEATLRSWGLPLIIQRLSLLRY
jgi:hypothetical protein